MTIFGIVYGETDRNINLDSSSLLPHSNLTSDKLQLSYSSKPLKRDRLTLDPQLLPISNCSNTRETLSYSPISISKSKRVSRSSSKWPTPGICMRSCLEDEIDDVLPKTIKKRKSSSPTEKIKISSLLNNILSSSKPSKTHKRVINEDEIKDNSKNWLNDLNQSLTTLPTDSYLKPDKRIGKFTTNYKPILRLRELMKIENKINTYLNYPKYRLSSIITDLNHYIMIDIISMYHNNNNNNKYIQYECIYNNKPYIGIIQEVFHQKHNIEIPSTIQVYNPYVITDKYLLIFIYNESSNYSMSLQSSSSTPLLLSNNNNNSSDLPLSPSLSQQQQQLINHIFGYTDTNINLISSTESGYTQQQSSSIQYINYNEIKISNSMENLNIKGRIQNIYFHNLPFIKKFNGIMLILSSSSDNSTLIFLHINETIFKKYKNILNNNNIISNIISITNCKVIEFKTVNIYDDLYSLFDNNNNIFCPRIIVMEVQQQLESEIKILNENELNENSPYFKPHIIIPSDLPLDMSYMYRINMIGRFLGFKMMNNNKNYCGIIYCYIPKTLIKGNDISIKSNPTVINNIYFNTNTMIVNTNEIISIFISNTKILLKLYKHNNRGCILYFNKLFVSGLKSSNHKLYYLQDQFTNISIFRNYYESLDISAPSTSIILNNNKEVRICNKNNNDINDDNIICEYIIPKDIFELLINDKDINIEINPIDNDNNNNKLIVIKGNINNIIYDTEMKESPFEFGCKLCNNKINNEVNENTSKIYCNWCNEYTSPVSIMKCILEVEISKNNIMKVSIEAKKMFLLIKKYIPNNCVDPDIYIENMNKLIDKEIKLLCVKNENNMLCCISNGII